MHFHFIKCNGSQFTCNDGLCVGLMDRCDEKFDCFDKSDEKNCQKTVIDENVYHKKSLPYIEGEMVNVSVSIYLLSVNQIKLPTTFNVKFRLVLFWKDYR